MIILSAQCVNNVVRLKLSPPDEVPLSLEEQAVKAITKPTKTISFFIKNLIWMQNYVIKKNLSVFILN